jgi:hypothetical protein
MHALDLGKRHYLAVSSVVLIMLSLIALAVGTTGCNAPSASVEIRDWNDLNAARNNLDGTFTLMNDLDATTAGYAELASSTANDGSGWQPIGIWPNPFTGSFDGQGFEIRELFIGRPDEDTVGLFSFVNEGASIVNVVLMGADVTGELYAGILAGHSRGTVSNCYSTGSVTGDTFVGGLMGENGGTVSNSYSTAIVNGSSEVGGLIGQNHANVSKSYAAGSATGDSYVGGLVGWNHDGTISNSYSTGNVVGELLAGGLVGQNRALVSDCYSTGKVVASEDVGGLVGRNYEGTVTNSFWDVETSLQDISDGGTGETTADMHDIDTFSGATWNVVAVAGPGTRNTGYVWNIVNNLTYPFLSWQPLSQHN